MKEKTTIKVDSIKPLIKCKDCKYYYAYPDEYRTCHEMYECDGTSKMMPASGFCSLAERKENGN